MKKLWILLLAACLVLLAVQALAESGEPAGEEFMFRGKIRWGMSEEEVTGLEGESEAAYEVNGFRVVNYGKTPVSRYHGYLSFVFSEDRLLLAGYGVMDEDPGAFEYLEAALSKVYGDELETSVREFWEVARTLNGDQAELSEFQDILIRKWEAQGGTVIFLGAQGNSLEISYISPEFMKIAGGTDQEIDITGL